jgi:hypothetical protein
VVRALAAVACMAAGINALPAAAVPVVHAEAAGSNALFLASFSFLNLP